MGRLEGHQRGRRLTPAAPGRDESRPYIPDSGHLLPLLPSRGEKYGLVERCSFDIVMTAHSRSRL